jgi:hypothetical protein
LNHSSTYLHVNLEGVLVGVAQTAHVLEVRGRDGEAEVNVWRLHQLLQMIVVTNMIIVVKTLMIYTGFECHRRGIGSLVMAVVHSPRVCCVRGGFHGDRGW